MYKYMNNVSQVFKKTKGFFVYMFFWGEEYGKLVLELTYFFKSVGEGGGTAEGKWPTNKILLQII